MSMSTFVRGIVPTDEKYKKMRQIYDLCIEQGIDLPKEVDEFFDGEEPCEEGMEIDIPHEEYENDMTMGIIVKVKDIPENVTMIKFYNSW